MASQDRLLETRSDLGFGLVMLTANFRLRAPALPKGDPIKSPVLPCHQPDSVLPPRFIGDWSTPHAVPLISFDRDRKRPGRTLTIRLAAPPPTINPELESWFVRKTRTSGAQGNALPAIHRSAESGTANASPHPAAAPRGGSSRPSDTHPSCHACPAGQPGGFSAALRPRWREVTGLRVHAARSGTDAHGVAILKRRTTWNSQPSSPSGASSSRRLLIRVDAPQITIR